MHLASGVSRGHKGVRGLICNPYFAPLPSPLKTVVFSAFTLQGTARVSEQNQA